MLGIYKYGEKECTDFLSLLDARAGEIAPEVYESVTKIIADVKKDGDAALFEYTKKFDKFDINSENIEVSRAELEEKAAELPERLKQVIDRAAANIFEYHEKQKRHSFINTERAGKITGQRIRALSRAGIYVPGGTAAYPSSVLMNCIPARVAGVGQIVMVTPPQKNGLLPSIAYAALVAGVDRVFLCGGAQAVAALAYGTESVPKVDIIAGPGNIYVAAAKRLVYGTVGIDMFAGPSEILIVADGSANPAFVAADLLSQAEHDILASAVLVTDSEPFAKECASALEEQLGKLERQDIARKSIEKYGAAIVCENIDEAVLLANELAPEHLEIMTKDPMSLLAKADNAGSVFLGEYSPEPLGDYFAGPNHVLPTNKTARFSSPLSVDNFIKKSGFVYYSKDALCEYCDDIYDFAMSEGLFAHANSVKIRFSEEK